MLEQNDILVERIREKYFHDLIIQNHDIQSDLLSIFNLPPDLQNLNLIHEDQYINGITADFTLVYNNKIRAIIECKAGDIGVTDYVRGIGQVLQYEHFNDKKISSKGIPYDTEFNSVLLIPATVFQNRSFNIGKFKYPETTWIIEINEINKAVRKISQKELIELSTLKENSLTSISQYYIRDNRIFEIYLLLRYVCILKLKHIPQINRVEQEIKLKKIKTINNGNWRNAWISLSSLGFIDSNNLPTKSGSHYGNCDFDEFLSMIYDSYIKPYVDLLMNYLSNPRNLNKSLNEIRNDLITQYSNKDILYLTQSETRYLSSWLNILRDDFGCIEFDARSHTRRLIYNPIELNENSLRYNIRKYTHSTDYIKNLELIFRDE